MLGFETIYSQSLILVNGFIMTINTLCIFGTRPEAIKMAPLVKLLNADHRFSNKVCVTGQHQQMLQVFLEIFQMVPDLNLNVMTADQDLSTLTTKIMMGLKRVFEQWRPNIVLVHGDTTTTLAAALSAYYHRIPIGHVEAGLRTGNINLPWPEEANRKLTDAISSLHFAPTDISRQNLLKEGYNSKTIFVTGNTVIDALLTTAHEINNRPELLTNILAQLPMLKLERRIILVTGHRRENFGAGFERICNALLSIALRFPEVDIIYPVHLNPSVQKPVCAFLGKVKNIYLIPPIDYLAFVYLMKNAYMILTDSGGIQEEAPSLGKPVLIMRDKTERPEAIVAGTAKLVGTNVKIIMKHVEELLTNDDAYAMMSCRSNPYGDGTAAQKIVDVIASLFHNQQEKVASTTMDLVLENA